MDGNQPNTETNNTPPVEGTPTTTPPVEGAPVTEPIISAPTPETVPQPEPTVTPAVTPAVGPNFDEAVLNPAPEAPPEVEEGPRKPTISVQAELETPIEVSRAPMDPLNAKQIDPRKRQKLVRIILAAILILILAGFAVWYFLLNNEGKPTTPIAKDQQVVPTLEPVEPSQLILKNNSLSDFDLAFLHLENKTENVVYSPLSIKYALAMLQEGANGQSKAQIDALIGDYKPKAYLNSANRSLANAMFVRNSFKEKVLPTYTDALAAKYNASLIFDSFADATPINKWVSDKTLGIINQFVDQASIEDADFMLVNALAIDMNWNNQLQCAPSSKDPNRPPCIYYSASYKHENYKDFVSEIFDYNSFDKITFNGQDNTVSAKIGASANRYDIVKELGEDKIRQTVEEAYQEQFGDWDATTQRHLEEGKISAEEAAAEIANHTSSADEYYRKFYSDEYLGTVYDGLNQYVQELNENYGQLATSTDFYFLDTDAERVFAKDLKEYDGSTLQYVGIMPKSGSLNAYLNNLTAEKATSIIASLKDPTDINNYKEGVITKITAHIPFFEFDYEMKNFKSNLQQLGIADVFDQNAADLSNLTTEQNEYIYTAIHKTNIEFSNDGIRAAAATGMGGRGAAGPWDYKFDVPVEEIDLTFDKPFLFLIRDKSSGEVWFVGTVYKGVTNE